MTPLNKTTYDLLAGAATRLNKET